MSTNSLTMSQDGLEDGLFFDNLVWLNSEEAARYLRKTVAAIRTAVCRGQIKARKWRRRLYFKRRDLEALIEHSERKGAF